MNPNASSPNSVCVRQIFEALHSERIVARDILDQLDADFSTAKYLWATWKAHNVMSGYLKSRFYKHQSITAVISWHLADNFVKPDDSLSNKVTTLEKSIDKLTKSVSSIESSVSSSDKALSALDKQMKGIQTKLDCLEQCLANNERPQAGAGTP